MLQDPVNRLWRAHVQFLRGSRPLSLANRIFFARKPSREKPSLIVAIGKHRKGSALEEYRRRFASPAGQENPPASPSLADDQGLREQPAQSDRDPAKPPERGEKSKPRPRFKTRRRHRRGGSGHFYGAAWTLLRLVVLRGYYGVAEIKLRRSVLIGVTLACAIGLGGAYIYRTVSADGGGPLHTIPPEQPLDEKQKTTDGRPDNNKLFYDRLRSDADETATASPAVPPAGAGQEEPSSAGPVNRADGLFPEGRQSADAPAPSQPVAAERQVSAEPTVVRGEIYLPDGTRTDIAQAAPVPAIAPAGGAASKPNGAPAGRPPVQVAEPLPPSDNGYFAQVKSDQDEKAAEAELAAVVEKYKAVLGEVPLITRTVDLKGKGIWFRVLAGPLKSRDEAEGLCKKLKSAGLQACIVQKFD